ncbi:MAG: F0F1 ATP synthase subunit epsilon [Angustibacter sp.]
MSLTVDLVAADRRVWSGQAQQVTARTSEGEIGVLPGHAPLLGLLVEGPVRISGAESIEAEVDGGFLSVANDRVTIVAESAQLGAQRVS